MLIPLFALIAPFFLWPIELIFPYPHIVEELYKLVLVFFILNHTKNNSDRVKLAFISGLLFAFSESIFYMPNILLVGTYWTFLERLILTIPLHVITILLILFLGVRRREFIALGLAGAILIHYFFNVLIGKL